MVELNKLMSDEFVNGKFKNKVVEQPDRPNTHFQSARLQVCYRKVKFFDVRTLLCALVSKVVHLCRLCKLSSLKMFVFEQIFMVIGE